MKTPKNLRKLSNNRIFAYTPELAKLPGMVPLWDPGEEPEPGEQVSGGLEIGEPSMGGSAKKVLREKDKTIANLSNQLDVMSSDNQILLDQIAALENVDATEESPVAENDTDDDRMEKLVEATAEMLTSGNANDLTGSGVPRVESLEAKSGITEVTAQERNRAFDEAQKLLK